MGRYRFVEPAAALFFDANFARGLIRFYITIASLVSGLTFGFVLVLKKEQANPLAAALAGALTLIICAIVLPYFARPLALDLNIPAFFFHVGLVLVAPFLAAALVVWAKRRLRTTAM